MSEYEVWYGSGAGCRVLFRDMALRRVLGRVAMGGGDMTEVTPTGVKWTGQHSVIHLLRSAKFGELEGAGMRLTLGKLWLRTSDFEMSRANAQNSE